MRDFCRWGPLSRPAGPGPARVRRGSLPRWPRGGAVAAPCPFTPNLFATTLFAIGAICAEPAAAREQAAGAVGPIRLIPSAYDMAGAPGGAGSGLQFASPAQRIGAPDIDGSSEQQLETIALSSRLVPATAALADDATVVAGLNPDYSAEPAHEDPRYHTFGSQFHAIRWEVAAIGAYYTAVNSEKLFQHPIAPHFQSEGYFGRSTNNVGVDKLAHAYSSYVISEILYSRLKYKTDGAPGIQYTAAALGFGMMLYTEAWDSIERTGGWSWEDVSMNVAGASFSVLRNSVPGLDKKLDYRLLITPDSSGYHLMGKKHFEQQTYFFALKLSGFEAFERTPARFLELHLGYHAKDFTTAERAAGIEPKRKLFVGLGINLRELFFKDSDSTIGRAAGEVLDYFQPPYTEVHVDLTK